MCSDIIKRKLLSFMALIDTHSIVEDLIAAGFAKSQAEALTRLKILHYEDLASKKDLEHVENSVRHGINVLDTKVDEIKTEVSKVKTEVSEVKTELNEIKTDVKIVKSEMQTIKWVVGISGALTMMLVSAEFGKFLI